MVEQRAGRRLAALDQPAIGKRRAVIGSPAAGEWPRRFRERHDAARCAGNQRQMAVDAVDIAGEAAEHTQRTGISIDEPGPHTAGSRETERCCGVGSERAKVRADRGRTLRQAPARQHVGDADRLEKIRLPALVMRQIGPFRRQRALRTRQRAAGFPGQEIGEVEKIAGFPPAFRQIPLQPHQLRRLHFRRHDAAEMVEHAVAGGGALVGFAERPMVEPDDRVQARLAARRHRELVSLTVADNQRTCRIETDPGNRFRGHTGFLAGAADRVADSRPDLFRIVLSMPRLRPVDGYRAFGAAKQACLCGRGCPHARCRSRHRRRTTSPGIKRLSRSLAAGQATAACRRISGPARARR